MSEVLVLTTDKLSQSDAEDLAIYKAEELVGTKFHRVYVTCDQVEVLASADVPPDTQRPARLLRELLVRVTEDADGNSLGKDEHGGLCMGYKALDTGEIVWQGTFEDIFAWAGTRTGIEPIDRHMAYWERRYAARRFARRLGNLPSYPDLYAEHKQAISLLRDLVAVLDRGLEPDQVVLDHVKERYMQKPTVYDLERV